MSREDEGAAYKQAATLSSESANDALVHNGNTAHDIPNVELHPNSSLEALPEIHTLFGKAAGIKPVWNAMTVDVEDYFQVSAFEKSIERDSWNSIECRVQNNVDRILQTFNDKGIKATFFTLGWVGIRFPDMLRRIVGEGHELASHGWDHERLVNFTPEQFRIDVLRTRETLEHHTGVVVKGYRAPGYSVAESNLWVHDVLLETGHKYSSSIAPIKYKQYGLPDAPRFPHFRKNSVEVDQGTADSILEVPITTLKIGKRNIPCGGGGWFRLYPYYMSRWALQRVNEVDEQPCVFYYHPWEIDVEQPRQTKLNWNSRFRHYQNLRHMEGKINRLLDDFSWHRMDEVFQVDSIM